MSNLDSQQTNHSNGLVKQASLQTSNLLVTLLVAALSFSVGFLFSQVKTLQSGKALGATTVAQAGTTPGAAAQPTEVPISTDKINALFTDANIHFGDKNAKLTFVEFSDFSCPYCQIAGGKNPELAKTANFAYDTDGGKYSPPVPKMKELVDAGKARMVILYATGHGQGKLSQEAAYCANEQGKYWETHDLLMSNAGYTLQNDTVKNDREKIPDLVTFLASAVDTDKLTTCLNSKKYEAKVTKDDQLAASYGVAGTPEFIVNTTPFKGAYSWTDMQTAVGKTQ